MKKYNILILLLVVIFVSGCTNRLEPKGKDDVLNDISNTVPIECDLVSVERNKNVVTYTFSGKDRDIEFEAYSYTYVNNSGKLPLPDILAPVEKVIYNTYWYEIYRLYHSEIKSILLNSDLDIEIENEPLSQDRNTRTSYNILVKNEKDIEILAECIVNIDKVLSEELEYASKEDIFDGIFDNGVVCFNVYVNKLEPRGKIRITPYIFDRDKDILFLSGLDKQDIIKYYLDKIKELDINIEFKYY